MKDMFAINQGVLFPAATEKFFELSSEIGLNNVELRVPKAKELLYHLSKEKIKQKLNELNISVIAMNSLDDFGMVPYENIGVLTQETKFVGEICKVFNCDLVIAPVGRWFEKKPDQNAVKKIHVDRLNHIADILSDYGVNVGLEPVSFPEFTVQNIFLADEIVQESNNVSNGLIIDFYNLFNRGMEPSDFSKLKSLIHLIHINDAEDLPLDDLDVMTTREFPGDGFIKPEKWIKQAVQSGYQGYFSLELFRKDLWGMKPDSAMYKVKQKMEKFKMKIREALEEE